MRPCLDLPKASRSCVINGVVLSVWELCRHARVEDLGKMRSKARDLGRSYASGASSAKWCLLLSLPVPFCGSLARSLLHTRGAHVCAHIAHTQGMRQLLDVWKHSIKPGDYGAIKGLEDSEDDLFLPSFCFNMAHLVSSLGMKRGAKRKSRTFVRDPLSGAMSLGGEGGEVHGVFPSRRRVPSNQPKPQKRKHSQNTVLGSSQV